MQVYTKLQRVNAQNTYVALGYFDGVHSGHKQVINAAINAADDIKNTAVFTFTPQKQNIKGKSIFSLNEKLKRLEAAKISHCLCANFEEFCNFSKEQFVSEILVNCLNAKQVFCGDNFTFGKNKSGNVKDLISICNKHDIKVVSVKLQEYKGGSLSSSRIKACIESGDIISANEMLGMPYSLEEMVEQGKKIGRTIGFPTINQFFEENLIIPKGGVYLTRVIIGQKKYAGATSVGTNPTFGGKHITCETYIVGYSGDLYGKTVRVEFLKYHKPSIKFENVDILKEYINEAAKAATAEILL